MIAEEWAQLCRWDPSLPPENEPPLATEVVRAIASAMCRPQPLAWGLDPDVQAVVEDFASTVAELETAMGQLICLRETLRRDLSAADDGGDDEIAARMHMVMDRALQVTAGRLANRLEQEALIDPLTGLLNRRGLERDLRREVGRAGRYRRPFTLMVIDVDGLKAVNDRDGHLAGDLYLKSLSRSLQSVLRSADQAYRVGGDEFVVLLGDTGELAAAEAIVVRAAEAGAPPFSWGASTWGADGEDGEGLLDLADQRLYERRAAERRT